MRADLRKQDLRWDRTLFAEPDCRCGRIHPATTTYGGSGLAWPRGSKM